MKITFKKDITALFWEPQFLLENEDNVLPFSVDESTKKKIL